MIELALAAAARGAILVTPNKRLARDLVDRHDAAQKARGRVAWPAARALPWSGFVDELWQVAHDGGLAMPERRLDALQAAQLWRAIVETDLQDRPLVDVDATAELAAGAWELVHAHGAGGESWRGFDASGDDARAFGRWAGAFSRETVRLRALDPSRAPDVLARHAAALPGVASLDVVLCGFLEPTAQQRRCVESLRAAGARIALLATPEDSSIAPHARRASAPSLRDELVLALRWARERARAAPGARIGIVVPDLVARRSEVRALADEVLCPSLQWPDALERPRPYNVSVGEALLDVPPVSTAFDLVALAHGPIDTRRAAPLVRSPYLPGVGDALARRAALERRWAESAVRELSLDALVASLGEGDPLAARWRRLREVVPMPLRATPRQWVQFWRAWLDRAGWCEEVPLGSAEFQARGAWADLLAGFVRLGAVAPRLRRDEALAALRRTTAAQTFQPESAGADVEVLGVLEASGLAFDALWVTGLTAEAWPRAPDPNPLLPIAWQREHGVPHSHAERELEYARRLTTALSHAAPEVVFSYAASADDHPCAPSPLIASLPAWPATLPGFVPTAKAQFASRVRQEAIDDCVAPPVSAGTRLGGGAGLLDAQSTCPFKAVAQYRLGAQAWPAVTVGLSKMEQGTIVHATLAAFWRERRDHAALVALGDAALDAAIERAVAIGLRAVPKDRWTTLPPVVAEIEGRRVASLVREWLEAVERARTPFEVLDTEARRACAIGGIALDVTLDRVDRLADGSTAIVDYKTGRTIAPSKWFGPRPEAPQLAVYALAHAQSGAAPVAALAYGQLRPGETRAVGVAATAAAWPALLDAGTATAGRLAGWTPMLDALETQATALAEAIRAGDARVSPRDNDVCTRCSLQPLCRIRAVHDLAAEGEAAGTGDG